MKFIKQLSAVWLVMQTLSSCTGEEGFTIRGTKGYDWTPEQCIQEIPYMKEAGMNFFAPCYLSFYDEHGPLSSMAELNGYNNWWREFTESQQERWRSVVKECRRNGIQFCFGMNPMLYSDRPLDTSSEDDYRTLLKKYRWFQKIGVRWFYVALDDLHLQKNAAIESDKQFLFVNRLYDDLKKKDGRCRMIFCPTWYWGKNLDNSERRPYLERMSEVLDKDILVFWTGEQVVSPNVSVADVMKYKDVVKHEMIFWDNYPVNDFHNTIYVGPVTGRDPGLKDVLYGMMSNPMRDNMMNRMPMLTVGDFMCHPESYDPVASIESAIGRLAENDLQNQVLHSLLAYYSSNYANGKSKTSYNHARAVFLGLVPRSRDEAEAYMEGLSRTYNDFLSAYPSGYETSKQIILNDLAWMKEHLLDNQQ